MSIGIVVTYDVYQFCGSSLTNTTTNLYNALAAVTNIYRQSFNVFFQITNNHFVIFTTKDSSTPNFNQYCPTATDMDASEKHRAVEAYADATFSGPSIDTITGATKVVGSNAIW
jgi:hypothetical protein